MSAKNSIKQAIDNVMKKDLKTMKENFSAALTKRAASKLEEMKTEMGSKFFK